MDWIDKMNSALDYIEDNLDKEINYEEIARKACCSSYNFQRMFSFIADVSLGEYIRRRKLTQAALDLQHEESSVIEVSLKYGYDSPVSFARAFNNLHGITPKEAKKKGIHLKSYPRISFKISIKGVEEMKYRIEKDREFRLIGKSKEITMKDGENFIQIPKFWNESCSSGVLAEMEKFASRSAVYGVCYDFKTENFRYMLAVESDKDIPDGYEEINIPQFTWVKFECRGKLPEAQQNIWKRIFTEWFPTSGYEHANGPEIEWYSSEDKNSPDYLSEIWIPIIRSKSSR